MGNFFFFFLRYQMLELEVSSGACTLDNRYTLEWIVNNRDWFFFFLILHRYFILFFHSFIFISRRLRMKATFTQCSELSENIKKKWCAHYLIFSPSPFPFCLCLLVQKSVFSFGFYNTNRCSWLCFFHVLLRSFLFVSRCVVVVYLVRNISFLDFILPPPPPAPLVSLFQQTIFVADTVTPFCLVWFFFSPLVPCLSIALVNYSRMMVHYCFHGGTHDSVFWLGRDYCLRETRVCLRISTTLLC